MGHEEPADLLSFYKKLDNEYVFFKILDSFSGGYFVNDVEKGEMYYTPKLKKRLGIEDLPSSDVEADTVNRIHPEDVIAVLKKFEDAFVRKSRKIKMEFRIRTADLNYIWVHMKANIQYDQKGRLLRVFGVYVDITEPKKVNEAVQKSEEKYRSLFNSIDQGFFVLKALFNGEGDFEDIFFLEANRAAKKILGLDFTGKYFRDLKIDDDYNWLGIIAKVIKTGRSVRLEKYYEKSKRWYSVYIFGIGKKDNGTLGGIFYEITESKKAEEKINRQNEIMRLINNVYEKSTSCKTQKELGIECLKLIDEAVGGKLSLICEVKEDGNLRFHAVRINGFVKPERSGAEHPGAVPFYNSILKYGKSQLINNTSERPESCAIPKGHMQFDSFLGTPFIQNGKVLGLIGAANKTGGFKEEDRDLLEAVTPSVLEVLQRKKTEEELKKSEEKYRRLVESSPAGIYEIELPSGRFKSVNDTICSITGYSREELMDMHPYELLEERERTGFQERFRRLMEDGELDEKVEYTIVTKDGRKVYGLFNVRFVKDEKGVPLEASVIAYDITYRKDMEEELKKSEEKYRRLVESSPAGIYEIDFRTRRFLSVNDSITMITGYTKEELLNMDPDALLDGKSREVFRNRLEQWLSGTKPDADADYRIVTRNGRAIYALINAKFTKDENGAPLGASVIAYDITERRKMEDAVNRALTREQVLRDLTGRLLESDNPAEIMEEICNISADYIGCDVYSHLADRDGLKLDAHSEMSEYAAKLLQRFDYGNTVSGAAARSGERVIAFDIQSKSDELTLSARGAGVRSLACYPLKTSGRIIGALSFGSRTKDSFTEDDISFMETVSNHIAIALSRMLIAGELKESEEKALRLVEELKKADEDKNRFLSSLSHELRNPLATISAGLQLLRASDDREFIDNTMDIINRQMGHLCILVDDLLELTRITHGKMNVKKQRLDLISLVNTVVQDHASFLHDKKVSFKTNMVQDSLYIDADPDRISQAVGNLLHNASKYTEEGDGVLVSVYTERNEAVISVLDNGIGIDPEFLPQIFQPFSQADTSLDRHGGGLGLGLSITKGIAELHGGSITADSMGLGKGSEFIIRLPLNEGGEKEPDEIVQARMGTVPLKILIIEDNRDFAYLLSALLKRAGHAAYISHDGIDGVKRANELKPDMIFCDIGLPKMSGYEVAVSLKKSSCSKDAYLVALTGYAGTQFGEEASKAGFDCYIIKPVDADKISAVIAGYSGQKGYH